MARPSKYKPEYCDEIVSLMEQGASIEEVCLELSISKKRFHHNIRVYI